MTIYDEIDEITIIRGDKETLSFTHSITDTVTEALFYVRKEVDGTLLIALKLSTDPTQFDIDEVAGTADVTILPADSQALPAGRWYYDLEFTTASTTKTVSRGRCLVIGDIATDAAGPSDLPTLEYHVTPNERTWLDTLALPFTATDNYVLVYDSAGGTWQPEQVDGAGALLSAGDSMTGNLNMGDNQIIRPEFLDFAEAVNAIGDIGGGTQDIDLTLGNVVTATVSTSTTTFTFSNPPASGSAGGFTLILTNGGSQTVNWPASVAWADGTAPDLTASGIDILEFLTTDGGTTYYGFLSGSAMQLP